MQAQVRFSSDVDEYLEPTGVWVSKNWAHYLRNEYRPYRLPLSGYGYEDFYDEQDRVFQEGLCASSWRLRACNASLWPSQLDRCISTMQSLRIYCLDSITRIYKTAIHLSGILNVEMPFTPDDDTAKEIRDRIREQLKRRVSLWAIYSGKHLRRRW